MASGEHLPSVRKPGRAAKKSTDPAVLLPGRSFILVADSLQQAKGLAGLPPLEPLQVIDLHWGMRLASRACLRSQLRLSSCRHLCGAGA